MTLKSNIVKWFTAMTIAVSSANAKTNAELPNCQVWKQDIVNIISNAKTTWQKVEEGDFTCKQGNFEYTITIKNWKIITSSAQIREKIKNCTQWSKKLHQIENNPNEKAKDWTYHCRIWWENWEITFKNWKIVQNTTSVVWEFPGK